MSLSNAPAHLDGPPLDLNGLRWPADYPALADPGTPAIVWEGRTTLYGELDRNASAFCTLLNQYGVHQGDRIAYLGRNSDIYFSVVFGSMRAGTVLVPLNWRCTANELGFILENAEPKFIICDREFAGVAETAAGKSVRLLNIEGTGGLYDLIASTVPVAAPRQEVNNPVMLMYTSGTTGSAKGAVITQRMFALARHAEMISQDYIDWKTGDVILSPMPNFHMGALSWLLGAFCRGLTCVITSDVTPKGLIALCQRYHISRTFVVPTIVRGMLEEMKVQGVSLSDLREIHYGASAMDVGLLHAAMEGIGCRFLHHYGMTENTGTATRLAPADHDLRRSHLLRSVGKPQPGLSIEIRRLDGSIAPRGEAGEIWIKSPTVMQAYWRRPEATAEAIEDGWYRTGDGGYLDNEGFLFLTDRIKDMVVSGGENIYPIEVEAALRTHPTVLDAAVFGVPDSHWGEAVVAAVEFRPGETATESELKTHIRQQIAGYKLPKQFILGLSLPRTATGKVQRRMVKMMFAAEPVTKP